MLRAGHELLRRAAVVADSRPRRAGERDVRRVVEVVVPEGVEPVAAVLEGRTRRRLLRLVLGDDDTCCARWPRRGRAGRSPRGCAGVESSKMCCGRVEPQPVEVELVDPVARVGQRRTRGPRADRRRRS